MGVSDDPRHGGADCGAAITPGQRRFKALARFLVARGILSWFSRLETVDHDKVPLTGGVIIAPSHRSNIDTPLIGAALKRDSRFMAKETIFKSPFWTKFLVALGGFQEKRLFALAGVGVEEFAQRLANRLEHFGQAQVG